MSRRDDSVPMRHMLDHAREAVAMVRERSRRDLDTNLRYDRESRTFGEMPGRRPAGYVVAMPGSKSVADRDVVGHARRFMRALAALPAGAS